MLPTIKKSNPNYELNLKEEFKKYINPFKPNEVDVIVFNGIDIGRLRVVKTTLEIYIGGFQILPNFQNKGIGTKVLQDLIKASLDVNIPIRLEVRKVNSKAKKFYERNGFQETGIIEKDFIMKFNPLKYKEEIKKLIENFCNSFDKKDWNLMRNCLGKDLEVDYESFRGTPKHRITSKEYIEQRKIGLKGLRTVHKTRNYKLIRTENGINCVCSFEIRRYEENSESYFHSFGEYEFSFERELSELKIQKIKQFVNRIEGDKNIHGAFKK